MPGMRGVRMLALFAAGSVSLTGAASPPPATDVDTKEVNCLANAIYQRSRAVENPQIDMIAWIFNNRRARSGGSFCDLGADAPPPWEGLDLTGLARRYAADDPDAGPPLDAYRTELARYHAAQIIAYKVMYGWIDEDPTGGATEFTPPGDEE